MNRDKVGKGREATGRGDRMNTGTAAVLRAKKELGQIQVEEIGRGHI